MFKSYEFRLYPNKSQRQYFENCFGCVRFIYNKMLSDKIAYYKETKKNLNNSPAQYKKTFEWLKEVDSHALALTWLNLRSAYSNFFRNPQTIGFPKFKSKKNNHFSYTTYNQRNNIRILVNHVKLPKAGLVRIKQHRDFNGIIKSVTISKTPSGRYFASILIQQADPQKLPKTGNRIGLDLELKEFAITSTGEIINNPHFLKNLKNTL